ncbi:hypothetical protein HY385_02525 [Candidatus Daviesbacteria bacterium]|nr:hypothetical protein [Candidatus Daviesbacteria bacterium]
MNNKLITNFKKLHEQLIGLVDNVPIKDRDKIIFDKWSLKDILVHLIAWNDLDTSRITSLQKGETFEWVDDWDEFNKIELTKRQTLAWEEIYKDFVDSGVKLASAYQALDEKLWNKRFGPKNSITATKDLKGMIEHYEKDHIPQLEAFLLTLKS